LFFQRKKFFFTEEKRMVAGLRNGAEIKAPFLTFMVDDKMCVGEVRDKLMAHIDPEWHDEAITPDGCRRMILGLGRV
jgi:hypothetical protein